MEKNDLIYEKILIAKLKAGDKSAFSSIFSFYYANLVSFANIFLRDSNSSEEIVQDIFVYIWENHEVLLITSSLKSYLLKMVQNRCLNWIKHLKTRNNYSDFIINNTNLSERDTDNYVLRSELETKIETTLNLLPIEVKEAFILSRFDGKKYQEIADIQSVSVRTIEDRIAKALSLLKEHLNEYLIEFIPFIILISKL